VTMWGVRRLIVVTMWGVRRLLQMGVNNAEVYNNIGLCCFYAQQYDMTFHCLLRALALATDDCLSDVWYNIGHVALVTVVMVTPAAAADALVGRVLKEVLSVEVKILSLKSISSSTILFIKYVVLSGGVSGQLQTLRD